MKIALIVYIVGFATLWLGQILVAWRVFEYVRDNHLRNSGKKQPISTGISAWIRTIIISLIPIVNFLYGLLLMSDTVWRQTVELIEESEYLEKGEE